MIVSHSLYEDLRRVEKTNNRIAWTERLAAALAPLLADEEHAREVLGAALKAMKDERRPWHHGDGDGSASSGAGDEADPPLERLLAQALGTAAGLASKVLVDVEVVTAQRSELAGESLFQFGASSPSACGRRTSSSATRTCWPGWRVLAGWRPPGCPRRSHWRPARRSGHGRATYRAGWAAPAAGAACRWPRRSGSRRSACAPRGSVSAPRAPAACGGSAQARRRPAAGRHAHLRAAARRLPHLEAVRGLRDQRQPGPRPGLSIRGAIPIPSSRTVTSSSMPSSAAVSSTGPGSSRSG